jgi:hypothetical protein
MTGVEAIPESVQVARKNWSDWRDVFEHVGSPKTNPLLAKPDRFKRFCVEYSVQRTIRRGTHDDFRRELTKSEFSAAIRDPSGQRLDKLEGKLRKRFGTQRGRNSIRSALSKVAAFTRPQRFVAWDTYGKKGVNIALGRRASHRFNTYAEYLAAFDLVRKGARGQQIRDYVATSGARSAVESEPRFQRRILDMYLMKLGGRKL